MIDLTKYNFSQKNQEVSIFDHPLIIPVAEAWMNKKALLQDYYWGQIKPEQNNLTRDLMTAEAGYLIEVGEGKTTENPVRICFLVDKNGESQKVHNLIVVKKRAKLKVEVDCGSETCKDARHASLTEIYLEEGAKLELKMRHYWQPDSIVEPITLVKMSANSEFDYSYSCKLSPKKLHSMPKIKMLGEGAKFKAVNKLICRDGSRIKLGSQVLMKNQGQSANLTTKIVSYGGIAENFDQITGGKRTRGHIECDGLVLNENGSVASVPSIIAKSSEAELSHEAAIGKLNPLHIEYLMTRGLNRVEATKLIIEGFLD